MMAMAREFKRRVGNDADFDEALGKYGMWTQYLEGDEDYFYAEKIYLEYRLNVKSILHSLEMEGFENAERVYNDVRYGDVLKGYPIEEHPVDGDGWVRLSYIKICAKLQKHRFTAKYSLSYSVVFCDLHIITYE